MALKVLDSDILDLAARFLRELDLEKAIEQFYQYLERQPRDLKIVRRIYVLEKKRPHKNSFKRICHYIFDLKSTSVEFHELILEAYIDYQKTIDQSLDLSQQQLFNLSFHLEDSHLLNEARVLRERIKQNYAEAAETPALLKHACESLIKKRKMTQVKIELKYILTYYAESEIARWAQQQYKLLPC